MKNTIRKSLFVLTTIVMTAVVMSFVGTKEIKQDSKPWVVPESAQKMKNPTTGSEEDLKVGKTLYAQHCKSCHGTTGKGDGPKSGELDTPSGDFSTKTFQGQTDGSMFYKIKQGRDDMPSFKTKLPEDEDIWVIVDYVRTLAAK